MARQIPLLPLRELIVFPHEVVPLFVGREKSINALEEAMADLFLCLRMHHHLLTVITVFNNDYTLPVL